MLNEYEIVQCRRNRAIYSCKECCRYRECIALGDISLNGYGLNEKGGAYMEKPKIEVVKDFLNSIYWPKSKREKYGELFTLLETLNIRSVNKNDSRKCRLTCLEIKTKGVGSYESFDSYNIKYIDINHVGDTYAEVYIYDEDGNGLPQKIRLINPKISIII